MEIEHKEIEQNKTEMKQIEQKDIAQLITEVFSVEKTDPGMLSPLVLAYIGDGIYELTIRTILVNRRNIQVNKLNEKASKLAKAASQAAIVHAITEELTEEEAAAYRRGRNAKSYTVAKNASMSDYRHATGLEALCGYLYLSKQYERLMQLLHLGMERTGLLEILL